MSFEDFDNDEVFPEGFEAWHEELSALAKQYGARVHDKDAWVSDFLQTKSIEDAFFGEYPEFRPDGGKQHKNPCKECPWLRKSTPGWLGASEPGEFLALSDSGKRMPCHMTVDYNKDDWEKKAATAPQCAGRAIFLSNRCQVPLKGALKLPADSKEVFTRPHEFVAHHANLDPKSLEDTIVYELYSITRS